MQAHLRLHLELRACAMARTDVLCWGVQSWIVHPSRCLLLGRAPRDRASESMSCAGACRARSSSESIDGSSDDGVDRIIVVDEMHQGALRPTPSDADQNTGVEKNRPALSCALVIGRLLQHQGPTLCRRSAPCRLICRFVLVSLAGLARWLGRMSCAGACRPGSCFRVDVFCWGVLRVIVLPR